MEIRQVVQVKILNAPRNYTYEYYFDPLVAGAALDVGDRVELPPNMVQEEGSAGTVVTLGSDYDGPMKRIVRRIEVEPPAEDDLWAGMEDFA